MLQKLLHLVQGAVTLRVESPYPERFLNLCGAGGIRFWGLRWESEREMVLCLTRRDYKRLRHLTGKLDCAYRVEKRRGFVFFARRFRRRGVLLAGLAGVLAAAVLGSCFVWDFEIRGNENVSEEEILRALEECGVRCGTFGLGVDSRKIRNKMLLKIPALSYLAVNISGSRAYVQVRERVAAPEMTEGEGAQNIVAAKSGLVTQIEAFSGEKAVLPGTSVKEGDLLISGVSDTDTAGARLLAGMGSVTARTWYSLTVPVAGQMQRKVPQQRQSRLAVVLGRRRVNFYGNNSSISGLAYDTINSRMRWILPGDVALPVTWVCRQRQSYSFAVEEVSAQEAQKLAEEILTEYLQTLLAPGGKVISTLTSLKEAGDGFYVTLWAECEEEIGRSEKILQALEE